MAGRDQSFRPRRIASQHPRLLALSSAAVLAGVSLTQRLIRQQSRRRSIHQQGQTVGVAVDTLTRPALTGATAPGPAHAARPDPGVRETYGEARRALRRLREQPRDEHWQELARRSTELGRRIELLAGARPKQVRKLARQTRRLSTLLGQEHDLTALGQRLREHPAELRTEDLELIDELINRRRGQLRRKAGRLAEALYRRKPGRFSRDVGLS